MLVALSNIKRLINKIQLRYYKYNSWNYILTILKLEYSDDLIDNQSFIFLKHLNLKIIKNKFKFLLLAYDKALRLKGCPNTVFKIENNKLFITINELTFEIQTAEELFILNEIFIDGIYNFSLYKEPRNYVLIDIGMNVAYASCYFTKVKKIPHIISFEPFLPTYNQAKKNISANNLERIIDPRNYGLGSCNTEVSVEYTAEFKGQVGVQGVDSIRSSIRTMSTEKISIKKAFEPLDKIEKEYPHKNFILKIDCEGAEYDLIELIPKALLERCDLIMMEWHKKGPKQIEEWLVKNGFIQMSFYPHSRRVGMIYAIKST